MSTTDRPVPDWLRTVLVEPLPNERSGSVLVDAALHSSSQSQTEGTFSFKWSQSSTFDRAEFRSNSGNWYVEKYGPVTDPAWWSARTATPLVVEIGCGSGISAEYLIGDHLKNVNYLGIDISTAVEVANQRLRELGGDPWFLRADILKAQLRPQVADLVFSEGVLHHTDDTQAAVKIAASLVAPGGRLAFYVYRKKAPGREFTDDHIRQKLAEISPEAAWDRLMPLTKLGRALGELHTEVTVTEDVDLLGIPKGTYDLQRLFYWHFFKAYYRPDFTLDEMNHINFDWYTPTNCHRHTPAEVQGWIDDLGFETEWFRVEDAGITVVAKRPHAG